MTDGWLRMLRESVEALGLGPDKQVRHLDGRMLVDELALQFDDEYRALQYNRAQGVPFTDEAVAALDRLGLVARADERSAQRRRLDRSGSP